MRINLSTALVVLLLCLSAFTIVSAQNANIRGFVYESESAEPVIFTSVTLKPM
jgi:hypothetical protein